MPRCAAGQCCRRQVSVPAWVALPKQYLEVAGATLLEHSLRPCWPVTRIAAIVVALHPQDSRAAA